MAKVIPGKLIISLLSNVRNRKSKSISVTLDLFGENVVYSEVLVMRFPKIV